MGFIYFALIKIEKLRSIRDTILPALKKWAARTQGAHRSNVKKRMRIERFFFLSEDGPFRIDLGMPRCIRGKAALSIVFPSSVSGELILEWEKKIDHSGKALGISDEMQTGDRIFDECFYIDSDDRESFLGYFSSPEIRQSIIDLFSNMEGKPKICLSHGRVIVEVSPISPEMFRRMDLQRIVENLRIIAKGFSKEFAHSSGIEQTPPDSIPDIKTGDRVRVGIGRGFLGWPWCRWDRLEWGRNGEEKSL